MDMGQIYIGLVLCLLVSAKFITYMSVKEAIQTLLDMCILRINHKTIQS